MRFLLDVNIDARRTQSLRDLGLDAIQWSAIGDPRDLDDALVAWARTHHHVLVTQDEGIATELARTGAAHPSVIQVRHAIDLGPELLRRTASVATAHSELLARGAVVVLDARTGRARGRPLPIESAD